MGRACRLGPLGASRWTAALGAAILEPMTRWLFTLALVLSLVACDDRGSPLDAGADAGPAPDAAPTSDAGPGLDASSDAGPPADGGADGGPVACLRELAPADRDRFVVVAHPFDASHYRVLTLSREGVLEATERRFVMGEARDGVIAFTPDGEIGVAAQTDGSLGVFRLDEAGMPTVLHTALRDGFYASGVVMAPEGDAVWVQDVQWRESGGGIYRIPIGCDGRLGPASLRAPGRLPYGLAFLADGRAVIASKDLLDETVDAEGRADDVRVVDLAAPSIDASGEVFVHTDWIGAGFALTADGRHALIGDNAAFSDSANRVGVAAIEGGVTRVQELAVDDPVTIVTSPFDDLAIVVNGFGNAIFAFAYDASASPPFTAMGELEYATRRPALPHSAAMIERGPLEGLVLLSENVAVRRLRFEGEGVITDLGPLEFGEGASAIAGAIGVQP